MSATPPFPHPSAAAALRRLRARLPFHQRQAAFGRMFRGAQSVEARRARHVMPAGAIVLGGAHGSLAVARSLGRHGVAVLFVTHDHPIAKFSRHTTRHAAWSGPEHAAALDELKAFAAQGCAGWVLIPSGDGEVRFVAQNHAALSPLFRLTTPDWEVVQWAGDKRLTYRRAATLGIPVPRSFYPRDAAEAAAIDAQF